MSWNNRDLDDQFGRPVYPTKSDEAEEEQVCGWGEGTVMQQAEGSMARQLTSTKQSLRLIAQSEEIGITAAQELDQQGEQLDNIERNLDKVNTDVRATQKHLDGIKSVFGGLKNWFTGAKKTAEEERKKTEEISRQRIERKREEESKLQKVINENQRISNQQRQANKNLNDNMFDKEHPLAKHEEVLNENLDLMQGGISRLKNLSLGLQNEIDSQNDQLEVITGKADRADTRIRDQNRQMGQILK